MIKISVNLDEQDARMLENIKAGRNVSKSDLIRAAIHEYCAKADEELNCVHEAIDAAYGACKHKPIDAAAIRKDSNESGRA
ncbi:MAG TPA: ribbon-helix-helix protein, CopG family [Tichowtungia sp.]|nr:ribbon-helix-helix protein, CopG family [Tichowtungia sp.]